MKQLRFLICLFILINTSRAFACLKLRDNFEKVDTIMIHIKYLEAKPSDTLHLILNSIIYPSAETGNLGRFSSVGTNGNFNFKIPVKNNCGYFEIFAKRTFTDTGLESNQMPITTKYFWEAGDDVKIELSHTETYTGIHSKCIFSGKGSEKYMLTDRMNDDSLDNDQNNGSKAFDNVLAYVNPYERLQKKQMEILEAYEGKISKLCFQVFKANIMFAKSEALFKRYKRNATDLKDKTTDQKEQMYLVFKRNRDSSKLGISKEALSNSRAYLFYQYQQCKFESFLHNGGFDPDWIYKQIIHTYDGNIRDRILLTFFIDAKKSSRISQMFTESLHIVKDSECIKILQQLIEAAPGKPFSDFKLEDVNGKMVRLSDFRGKKVLIDFWFNGCAGCATLYKNTLSRVEKEYSASNDVVFISICGDRSKSVWLSGIKSGNYTNNHNVNLYTNGAGFNHPLIIDNKISTFPFLVLLNSKGIIRYNNSVNLYDKLTLSKAIEENN